MYRFLPTFYLKLVAWTFKFGAKGSAQILVPGAAIVVFSLALLVRWLGSLLMEPDSAHALMGFVMVLTAIAAAPALLIGYHVFFEEYQNRQYGNRDAPLISRSPSDVLTSTQLRICDEIESRRGA